MYNNNKILNTMIETVDILKHHSELGNGVSPILIKIY